MRRGVLVSIDGDYYYYYFWDACLMVALGFVIRSSYSEVNDDDCAM